MAQVIQIQTSPLQAFTIERPQSRITRFPVCSEHGVDIIDVPALIFIEANGNYSTLHSLSRPQLLCSKTLKYFDERLVNSGFIRVHQSYLVNTMHILRYEHGTNARLYLREGYIAEVSRSKRNLVRSWIENLDYKFQLK